MSGAVKNGLRVIRQIVENSVKPRGFEAIFKHIEVLDGGDGRCVCELDVTNDFQNRFGSLHGGAAATLVDCVSTWALTSHNYNPDKLVAGVSVNMNVTYLKGAKVGEKIRIDANTMKCGRTLAFLDVTIKNSKGDLLVQGQHTKFVGDG